MLEELNNLRSFLSEPDRKGIFNWRRIEILCGLPTHSIKNFVHDFSEQSGTQKRKVLEEKYDRLVEVLSKVGFDPDKNYEPKPDIDNFTSTY